MRDRDPVAPSPVSPDRRARRPWYGGAGLAGTLLLIVLGAVISAGMILRPSADEPAPPMLFAPALVYADVRLDGAVVRGAAADWAMNRDGPLSYGVPVPVELTAYCLKGLTRRERYVRQGIVAADPRMFPLARYLEIYVGRKYLGRFLIDDTGGVIKGNRLDIWTPACSDARIFGRRQGTAVLVPKPRGAAADTLMTGRLPGRNPG